MAPTINMAPTAALSSGSGGRKAGIGNYTKPELENLFRCLRSILPIGPEEWDAVASLHAEKYPGRDTDSIRNKYIRLYRKKMPTGDPIKSWDVKQAKEIKYLIGDRASILNGEERLDLKTGEFVPADDDEEPFDPPPIPLCQPTQLTQATTQSTQGTTQSTQGTPPALLLGQPTQPTQIDEVTELTSTTLKEEREDRKLHQQALELQQRQQELQQRKVMLSALIAQLGTCGGPSTAEGKSVKRKLKDLRLSLADDCPLPPGADDDSSSSSNESNFE
eukprot:jgi/Psemu1/40201/gm1.40201_g